jgi:CHAT domain-containing protein
MEAVASDSAQAPAEVRYSAAIARLLMGDTGKAARNLRDITSASPTAQHWSDLAAARYTIALEEHTPEPVVEALIAADAALRLDPKLPEARFNRALVLERLGIQDLGIMAWRRYLEVDGGTEWGVEARTHLQRLTTARPGFRDELTRLYDRIASEPAVLHDLAQRFPQEVRTWGETEILGRWAEAELQDNTEEAAKHLRVARAFGGIAQARGDGLLADAVVSIDRADPLERKALALAHDEFRRAQKTFMAMKPVDAGPLFVRAAADFDRGHSPVALLARYFLANTVFEQRRTEEAAEELANLYASAPAGYRSARAQIQWELGLCRTAEGRYGEALVTVGEGRDAFTSLGETNYAATMSQILAWIHELIGDMPNAWRMRLVALPAIGVNNTQITQATLSAIAQTAVLRQDWPVALSFLELELEAAQRAQNDTFVADALLRRALVAAHTGRIEAATADLQQARYAIRRIPDEGMRSQVEGRSWWVEGMLAPTPAGKINALGQAIAFHETNVRRMDLPSLFYERALAYRSSGNTAAASRDLEAAMDELEVHRASLPGGESRWGVFHAAEEIFDEAIDVDLASGSNDMAFHDSERARARTLLDALKAQPDSSARSIPSNTVVIEYAPLLSRLVIFVASSNGLHVITEAILRSRLQTQAEGLQRAVHEQDESAVREAGRTLYAALIAPAAAAIPPEATVIVVPDATLSAIPFAALIAPNHRYLIEEHPIIVAPSASVYEHLTGRRSKAPKGPTLVVVNSTAEGRERLSDASAEAFRIARMYPQSTLLADREATAEAFVRHAKRAELIHFSGHALTSDQLAEETFLVLVDAAGHEQRLDVRGIAEMKLEHAPVVVLAACSTARGRVSPMEGTMSAARAFLAAGASSVVATLWPIDDRAAADFFTRIHVHLQQGETPADALRSTQIESIRASLPASMWAAAQVTGS